MGVEMRKSTSFISFPSLGVKQSSMAVSSLKPEPSGHLTVPPGPPQRGEELEDWLVPVSPGLSWAWELRSPTTWPGGHRLS